MLKYEINHAAGVPQTIVSGFAPRGEADHWTATATGRDAALSVVRNFINTRATVNASYHVLDWHDHEAEVTYAMEIVPLNRASHSMNPAKAFVPKTGSAREKARFAEVHRILARDTDPNADSVAVSFVGMPADLKTAVACPVYRADRRELSRVIRQRVATLVDRPHFGHGWIQPSTRYEMDAVPGGADLLIDPVLYADEEETMDWYGNIVPIVPVKVRLSAACSYRRRPDLTDASQPVVLGREDERVMIGTVKGFDFGAGPDWGVCLSNGDGTPGSAGLLTFHMQDILETTPLAGGFTQAQIDAAKLNARDQALRDAAAAVTALE